MRITEIGGCYITRVNNTYCIILHATASWSATNMVNTDALSHLPVNSSPDVQELACLMLIDAHKLPITSQQMAFSTGKEYHIW